MFYLMFQETTNEKGEAEIKLSNIEIKDQNTALNVLIHYTTIAQKRGIYSIQESAHIWSCIQMFLKQETLKNNENVPENVPENVSENVSENV